MQLIFGAGQLAFDVDRGSASGARRHLSRQLLLWNLGTVLVPIGVLAGAPGVVAIGSVVLLTALGLFATGTSAPRLRRAHERRALFHVYRTVVIFLAGRVIVGIGLAQALPWQLA